jgi:hypothetical protein
MNETLKFNGGNEYKLPHMNKDKLEKEGRLPTVLMVDEFVQNLIQISFQLK